MSSANRQYSVWQRLQTFVLQFSPSRGMPGFVNFALAGVLLLSVVAISQSNEDSTPGKSMSDRSCYANKTLLWDIVLLQVIFFY